MSQHTVRWYRQKLASFQAYLSEVSLPLTLSAVSPDNARSFIRKLQSLGRSAFTVRGYAQVLKGFGTWLVEEGYVGVNRLQRLRLPKVPKYVVKPLSAEEVGALLGVVSRRSANGCRDLALLLLLLDTGLRLGEAVRLTVHDADEAIRHGIFRVFGKGARERYIPLGRSGRDALRRYVHVHRPSSLSDDLFIGRESRPMTPEGLRQIIRRISERAGVRGVHPHRLRHTFAVNYLLNGGDAMSLQRILGHSTLEMVRNYVALDVRDIQAQHSQASPSDAFWAIRRGPS